MSKNVGALSFALDASSARLALLTVIWWNRKVQYLFLIIRQNLTVPVRALCNLSPDNENKNVIIISISQRSKPRHF
jgi:hypothetical protein